MTNRFQGGPPFTMEPLPIVTASMFSDDRVIEFEPAIAGSQGADCC
jgi:hypothetical protein